MKSEWYFYADHHRIGFRDISCIKKLKFVHRRTIHLVRLRGGASEIYF